MFVKERGEGILLKLNVSDDYRGNGEDRSMVLRKCRGESSNIVLFSDIYKIEILSNDISVDRNKISICKPVIYQNSIKVRFVIQNSLNLVIPFVLISIIVKYKQNYFLFCIFQRI